jgi:hypothetical protein
MEWSAEERTEYGGGRDVEGRGGIGNTFSAGAGRGGKMGGGLLDCPDCFLVTEDPSGKTLQYEVAFCAGLSLDSGRSTASTANRIRGWIMDRPRRNPSRVAA